MDLAEIELGAEMPSLVNAVIEIPRGSNMKYEYDPRLQQIRLNRVLYSPSFYPVDYGFLPQTRGSGGDHLDVLVVVNNPTFPGCIMQVRPLGVVHMSDEQGPDDKILAVCAVDPRFDDVLTLAHLAPHVREEIGHFFAVYKDLENKPVAVLGWSDETAARQLLLGAHTAWRSAQPAAG